MVTVTIIAGAVPPKGSGAPDYSRIVVGSQQVAVSQRSGDIGTFASGLPVTIVSGVQVQVVIASSLVQVPSDLQSIASGVLGKPAISGGSATRYVRGVVAAAGDSVIAVPASGKSLLVRNLHDGYLGNSGATPIGYRIGQGSPSIMDHQIGAAIPNWDKDLRNQEIQGPIRTASGIADLVIVVGLTVASGIGYTAVVEDA